MYRTTSTEDWEIRRKQILENFQKVAGPLPGKERRCPLDVRVHESEQIDGLVRITLSFASEPGDRVPAFLIMPEQGERLPAMMCLHQTTPHGKAEPAGKDGLPNLHYALELARRGYITLAPDYWFGPNCRGEYQPNPYEMGYESATMKGIYNHIRALDLLSELPNADPERIGTIGHSLGGHNSLFLCIFDRRVKTVVTSCGFTSFAHYNRGDLTGWSHDGYMPRIRTAYSADPKLLPFDFTDILAAAAPTTIFINAPLGDSFDHSGVDQCVEAATPVYALYEVPEGLKVHHPDCGHDFPRQIREKAYRFVDWIMGNK